MNAGWIFGWAGLLLLSGWADFIRLRPTNRDHNARKAEVAQQLQTPEAKVDDALKANQDECDALDTKKLGWTVTGAISGVLAGSGGLSTILTDNQIAKYVVGGLSIVVGVVGAAATIMIPHYSALYSHNCTINTGGK